MHNVLSAWHRQRGEFDVARHWHSIESDIAARATISVCSPKEAERLRPISDAAIILPHGVEPSEWSRPPSRSARPKLKLFGNWYWQPNRDGLAWFAERVWRELPDGLSCEIAGAGAESITLPPGVRAVGRVPSVSEFLSDAHLVAVPVQGGVGAPVKYLEALTSGVPTLATLDAAAFATPVPTFISDSAEEWVSHIGDVLNQPEMPAREALTIRAWALHEMHWARTSEPLLAWVEDSSRSHEPEHA
uniref:glycosyltransferase n=1 Tax=Georgenia sp. M64 TaxID=3120520 RepID=UPI004049D20E